jgi:hypothetical protein
MKFFYKRQFTFYKCLFKTVVNKIGNMWEKSLEEFHVESGLFLGEFRAGNSNLSRGIGTGPRLSRVTRHALTVLSIFVSFTTLIRGLGVWTKPASSENLSSFFPDPGSIPAWGKVLLSFFHFYTTGFIMYSLGLHAATVFVYAQSILTTLHCLK